MTTTTYQVQGMSCDHCVNAVSTEIQAIAGVRRVSVDLATGLVEVTSDEPIALGSVRIAVDEAGCTLT